MFTTSSKRAICVLAFAATAVAGSAALADPAFSFRSVEFLPEEQRQAAAEAFVQRAAATGAPVAQAVAALRQAGARCATGRDGNVSCTRTSLQRPPGDDMNDVLWRIDITTANGAVTGAEVHRTVSGV